MSYAPRSTAIYPSSTSGARQTSASHTASSQPSSALATRIAAKRSELENLKQLRDLSGALAGQMGLLEEKLATLRDGTEAVACVLANWDNVLRAISMASSESFESTMVLWEFVFLGAGLDRLIGCVIVKVPKPTTANGGEEEQEQQQQQQERQENGIEPQLPVTLVRIPAQSQNQRQRHVEADGGALS